MQEEGTPSIEPINSVPFPPPKGCGMSVLVGTGNILWSGIYVMVSTLGLVVTVALLNVFYINDNVQYSWYKGLLLVVCMAVSVVVFGGLVVVQWHSWERRTLAKDTKIENVCKNERDVYKSSGKKEYVNTIRYGQRPEFGGNGDHLFHFIVLYLIYIQVTRQMKWDRGSNSLHGAGIFGRAGDRWGHVDIGVVVCGPSTLQTSVAKECRTQNLSRRANRPVFHFNSHSFDL